MKKYWLNFKYIMEHKKNVFIECWRKGLYLHAFTHDLSKLHPKEFKAYARYFFTPNQPLEGDLESIEYNFQRAWEHHYTHNKHHWEYWLGKDMPDKYIKQMICDWKAMSVKFGDTPQEFYMKNYHHIHLSHNSRLRLEFELSLIDSVCLVSGVTWEDYCERIGISMEQDLKELGYIK